jgi:hypothetical protein
MFEVTVKHRNPSRDGEYTSTFDADGYVLVLSKRGADGSVSMAAHADGSYVEEVVEVIRATLSALESDTPKSFTFTIEPRAEVLQ